jgi:glucose/arabinose dehydrogenase
LVWLAAGLAVLFPELAWAQDAAKATARRGGIVTVGAESLPTMMPPPDQSAAYRRPDPTQVLAPSGYTVEVFAARLDFPIDITFSDKGELFIAESGYHGLGDSPVRTPSPQIIQVRPDGTKRVIYENTVSMTEIRRADSSARMSEGIIPPITGITWHQGKIYIAHRSRYSVLDPDDEDPATRVRTIVNGLPCWGPAVNAKPIFDRGGKMVFFVPAQSNAGVVDAAWCRTILAMNKLTARDVPGEDVTLIGQNFRVPVDLANHGGAYFGSPDERYLLEAGPRTAHVPYEHIHKLAPPDEAADRTGGFSALWSPAQAGQVVHGEAVCNGAFFRCDPDGAHLERIAWGFRSCPGYRFAPDGRLFCTHDGADPTEPRAPWFDFDTIHEVVAGEWYGWPDFFSGLPVSDPRFRAMGQPLEPLLAPETHRILLKGKDAPRQPVFRLPPQSQPRGMVLGRADFGVDPAHLLVAEMGTLVPLFKGPQLVDTAAKREEWAMLEERMPPRVPPGVDLNWPGFKVQILDLSAGRAFDFLTNKVPGPASAWRGAGLERPVQLEWGPDEALYVIDFGIITPTFFQGRTVLNAQSQTGVIWRVHRGGPEGNIPGR